MAFDAYHINPQAKPATAAKTATEAGERLATSAAPAALARGLVRYPNNDSIIIDLSQESPRHPKTARKTRAGDAYRLWRSLRGRGITVEVQTFRRLVVHPAGALLPNHREAIAEYQRELAQLVSVMFSPAEAAATVHSEPPPPPSVKNDWGARSLKFLVICARHGAVASAPTREQGEQYANDHRNIDACSAETHVRGSESDAEIRETKQEETGETEASYLASRK